MSEINEKKKKKKNVFEQRTKRKLKLMMFPQFSVSEATTRLLPFALSTPLLLIVHAVDFAAFFVFAARPTIGRQRRMFICGWCGRW
jgi:hypothetical protein